MWGQAAFGCPPKRSEAPLRKDSHQRFVQKIRIRVCLQAYRKRPVPNCALRRNSSMHAQNKTGVPTPCGGNAGSPFPHGDGGREDLRSESVVPDLDLHPAPPPVLICQAHVNSLSKRRSTTRHSYGSGAVWLSFRTSVLCAVRNLGEPRDGSRPLRPINRAFGSLPYQTAPLPIPFVTSNPPS
jgi:hypothetical protein